MQIRSKIQPDFQICGCEVCGKCARMPELTLLANPAHGALSASHDRTMQDIVYKLVPGLHEGEWQASLGSGPQRGPGASPCAAPLSSLGEPLSLVPVPNSLDRMCRFHSLSGPHLLHRSGSPGRMCHARRPTCRAVGAWPGTGACEVYLYLKRNTMRHTHPESLSF